MYLKNTKTVENNLIGLHIFTNSFNWIDYTCYNVKKSTRRYKNSLAKNWESLLWALIDTKKYQGKQKNDWQWLYFKA